MSSPERIDLIHRGVRLLTLAGAGAARGIPPQRTSDVTQARAVFADARRGLNPSDQLWGLCVDLEELADQLLRAHKIGVTA